MPSSNDTNRMSVPFFMVDIGNMDIIILPNVPLTVESSKEIKWVSTDVPGGSYSPLQFGSMGSQQISFTIRLAYRGTTLKGSVGNLAVLQQFDKLRTPVESISSSILGRKSNANPQVLFWYGTGNILPLIYYVTKCDFSHVLINRWNYPTVTDISMELVLDEGSSLYKAERLARIATGMLGTMGSIKNLASSQMSKDSAFPTVADKKPY